MPAAAPKNKPRTAFIHASIQYFLEGREMKKLVPAIAAGLLFFAAQAHAQDASSGPAMKPKASTAQKSTAARTGSAAASKTYDRALLRPALLKDKAPETFQVKFTTTKGDFTVSVTRASAPIGADRFYNLCKHHFYDNASFFRVVPGFVAQFGISAYPPVNAAWDKATIQDDPVKEGNKKYAVVFATAGPNTRTTQLFVNLVDNPRLDAMGFAAFGVVTDGMNIVDSINAEYGEGAPAGRGPDQTRIEKEGKPYLDKDFPNLDSIKTTTLIGFPAATPTHKTLPGKKTTPTQ
jgi:peptidyl-prolyl cis-trans isomerase A (cyclophilin A)